MRRFSQGGDFLAGGVNLIVDSACYLARMINTSAALKRRLKGRSKVTNQPTRLAGIDGRSSHGRRRRDLILTYADALGGADKVSAAAMNDIVRAVDLVVIAERARAAALRGEIVDLGDLTRLEGAADRAVRRLGIKPGGNEPAPNLAEYLASKYPANAAEAEPMLSPESEAAQTP
jgi:hypothetical protein